MAPDSHVTVLRDIPPLLSTFPCLSFILELPLPLFPFPFFYVAIGHQDDTIPLYSCVAYLYLIPPPGPGQTGEYSPTLSPLSIRVPTPQDSCYARYDSPRALSTFLERGLSLSPSRLCLPPGLQTRWDLWPVPELTTVGA